MSIKIIGKPLPNIPWQDRKTKDGLPVWRYDGNPIIGRNPTKCAARVFNSAVVPFGIGFIGVFRADTKLNNPQLFLGHSTDGVTWEIENEPIRWYREDGSEWPLGLYAYDPRVVEIDDEYYIIWCCEFADMPALGIGKTKDFQHFTRINNPFIPFNRNGVLFPKKINGCFQLLSRPSDSGHTPFGDIFISESPDMKYWGNHRLVMRSGSNQWESTKIGAGPVPIETSEGWLMIYHGVVTTCSGYVYSMGAALLDKDEPAKVKMRCKNYIFTPEEDYETTGFVPNVAFPVASLTDADTGRIAIYYGAADTYTALAFTTIDELYDYMKENNEVNESDSQVIR